MLDAFLRDWIPDVRTGQPLFAQIVGGNAVSVCCTVRRTSDAYEAGVETVPAFRGHGYAAHAWPLGRAQCVKEVRFRCIAPHGKTMRLRESQEN